MSGAVYLDHAATTPVRPAALAAFVEAAGLVGNPASVHGPGRAARRVLEDARESVAASLACAPDEVVLTSGGTEADNLAVTGLFRAAHRADPARRRVLVSAVEHPAVAAAADALVDGGAVVERVPVDADGVVDLDAAEQRLRRDPGSVALVACMWANNEVGAVQPVGALGALAAAAGTALHVDAVQAVGVLPVSLDAAGATALAVSGHKVGAPAGSGVLVVRRGTDLVPLARGGGQESGRRPGTVPVAAAAALAAALAEAVAARPAEAARLEGLRDRLVRGLAVACPEAVVSGPADPGRRLPSIAHVTVPGCDAEALLLLLDRHGVAASTGSACRSGVLEPSPVLAAMGVPADRARGAVRFSLGRTTTDGDVDAVLEVVAGVVAGARAYGTAA